MKFENIIGSKKLLTILFAAMFVTVAVAGVASGFETEEVDATFEVEANKAYTLTDISAKAAVTLDGKTSVDGTATQITVSKEGVEDGDIVFSKAMTITVTPVDGYKITAVNYAFFGAGSVTEVEASAPVATINADTGVATVAIAANVANANKALVVDVETESRDNGELTGYYDGTRLLAGTYVVPENATLTIPSNKALNGAEAAPKTTIIVKGTLVTYGANSFGVDETTNKEPVFVKLASTGSLVQNITVGEKDYVNKITQEGVNSDAKTLISVDATKDVTITMSATEGTFNLDGNFILGSTAAIAKDVTVNSTGFLTLADSTTIVNGTLVINGELKASAETPANKATLTVNGTVEIKGKLVAGVTLNAATEAGKVIADKDAILNGTINGFAFEKVKVTEKATFAFVKDDVTKTEGYLSEDHILVSGSFGSVDAGTMGTITYANTGYVAFSGDVVAFDMIYFTFNGADTADLTIPVGTSVEFSNNTTFDASSVNAGTIFNVAGDLEINGKLKVTSNLEKLNVTGTIVVKGTKANTDGKIIKATTYSAAFYQVKVGEKYTSTYTSFENAIKATGMVDKKVYVLGTVEVKGTETAELNIVVPSDIVIVNPSNITVSEYGSITVGKAVEKINSDVINKKTDVTIFYGIYNALNNSVSGDKLELVKAEVKLDKDATLKDGVELNLGANVLKVDDTKADKTITFTVSGKMTIGVATGITLGAKEKLIVDGGEITYSVGAANATAGEITINDGKIVLKDDNKIVNTTVNAAYVTDNKTYYNLEDALAEKKNVTISGKVISKDLTIFENITLDVATGAELEANLTAEKGSKLTLTGTGKFVGDLTLKQGAEFNAENTSGMKGTVLYNENSVVFTNAVFSNASTLKTTDADAKVQKLDVAISMSAGEYTLNGNIKTANLTVANKMTINCALEVTGTLTVDGTLFVGSAQTDFAGVATGIEGKVTVGTNGSYVLYPGVDMTKATVSNASNLKKVEFFMVIDGNNVPYLTQYGQGTAVVFHDAVTVDGYNFQGWFNKATDGTEVAVTDKVTDWADKSIYGQTVEKLYTVTLAEVTGAKYVIDGISYASGSVAMLSEGAHDIRLVALDGYSINDAKIAADGKNVSYANGAITVSGDGIVSADGVSKNADGLDITQILLIVLVVVVAILAVVIVMRLMRS